MCEMLKNLAILGILQLAACEKRVAVVSDRDCGGVYNLDDGVVHINYHGTRLNDCTFTIEETESSKKICVYFEEMDIASCETTLKVYGYQQKNSERLDFQTFSCGTERIAEYCPALVTELYIDLKHPGPDSTDKIKIRITCQSDATYIYLIVGMAFLLVVIIAIPVVILLRYRCKRRKASCGQNIDQNEITSSTYEFQ